MKSNKDNSNSRIGVSKNIIFKILTDLGWTWIPTMKFGTGCKVHLKEDELPNNILILSDMEFNACARTNDRYGCPDKRLFSTIAEHYHVHGYQLPRLVFWNVNSRTGTIPIKENELGVALVSGFSPAVVKMVLSNKLDPYECLIEQLNGERYQPVEEAVKELVV